METILIAGGTGLVGKRFIQLFKNDYKIKVLTRNPRPAKGNVTYHEWDLHNMTIDQGALITNHIVNLTGAGIADKRWSNQRKKVLVESRVKSNELLLKGLKEYNLTVKSFTCASAIGYYGDRGDEILTEQSESGQGFLAKCSTLWENSADLLTNYADKLSKIRIGLVLSTNGGALPKILLTKNLGILSYFGNGKQYYSWIHIDDLCKIILTCISNNEYHGTFNAVSPTPLNNKTFTTEIKSGLQSKALVVPAPSVVLRVVLGEMADVVLNSTRVIPEKLNKNGYNWKFTDLGKAVKDLVDRKV